MGFMDIFRSRRTAVFAATPSSADNAPDAGKWRKLGDRDRNLPGIKQEKMIEDAIRAYQRHPLALRAVRIKTGFVVGAIETKPQVDCKDERLRSRVEREVRDFWCDPRNDMVRRIRSYCDGLTVTGELPVALFTDAASKMTRIGYIDPQSINHVVRNPQNAQERVAIITGSGIDQTKTKVYPIVQRDGTVFGPFKDARVGSTVALPDVSFVGGELRCQVQVPAMYLTINDIPGQSRGVSDLYSVLDLLDLLQKITFMSADRAENMAAFNWMLKFDGSVADEDISGILKNLRRDIESGAGRLIGTKGFDLAAVSPTIQSAEWEGIIDCVRKAVLTGFGLPPVWVTDGNASFAAAGEMQSPALTMLQERQSLYRDFLEGMLLYVVLQHGDIRAAWEKDKDAFRISLPLPAIVGKDTMRESAVLVSDLNALATAESEGYLTKEAAQRFAAESLTVYGFTVKEGDQPDPEEASRPSFRTLPFPTRQAEVNEAGKEGGRGEDEDHQDEAA